jgi:hypothetical protein
MEQKRDSGWGVPPPQMQAGSGFPLYSSLGFRRCGVPLQSVTRNAIWYIEGTYDADLKLTYQIK